MMYANGAESPQGQAQAPSKTPCECRENVEHSAGGMSSFLKQLALSVTVAIVTSYMLEKFHGRMR